MEQKRVKIIGLSINQNFGGLKATELTFNEDNRLTIIKGEVGSGKTTLNKAMRLTTQGSGVLEDKSLYGDNVDITTQLSDGDASIFVGCKSDKKGALTYYLYTEKDGVRLNDVVVDGQKLTPANYLKSLQTALTWRLDELTSENPTTQRNILLELYSNELQSKGVIFDKSHPHYVGGIIDRIEKAKNQRSLMDMRRKEVGGIADDLQKKGIDFSDRKPLMNSSKVEHDLRAVESKILFAKENVQQIKISKLNELKAKGSEIATKLRLENDAIIRSNDVIQDMYDQHEHDKYELSEILNRIGKFLNKFIDVDGKYEQISKLLDVLIEPTSKKLPELKFNEKGTCLSKADEFVHDSKINQLLKDYYQVSVEYVRLNNEDAIVDTTELENEASQYKFQLSNIVDSNNEAMAVNALWDWKDADEVVRETRKDYFMKLTEINTGVKGLYICPEFIIDEKGDKIAKDNDIYLMYDGSYDPKYFNNQDKELRKLSSYSGTQKPMICLLIQNYLLSKKNKVLPYLWIDNIPIDTKTKKLLEKMSVEMNLWLFVNWTGDFSVSTLENGEILLENGEILFK